MQIRPGPVQALREVSPGTFFFFVRKANDAHLCFMARDSKERLLIVELPSPGGTPQLSSVNRPAVAHVLLDAKVRVDPCSVSACSADGDIPPNGHIVQAGTSTLLALAPEMAFEPRYVDLATGLISQSALQEWIAFGSFEVAIESQEVDIVYRSEAK